MCIRDRPWSAAAVALACRAFIDCVAEDGLHWAQQDKDRDGCARYGWARMDEWRKHVQWQGDRIRTWRRNSAASRTSGMPGDESWSSSAGARALSRSGCKRPRRPMQRCTGAPRRRTATCRSDGITAAVDLAADETTLLRPPGRGALTAFEPRHLAIARMRAGQAPDDGRPGPHDDHVRARSARKPSRT